MATIAPTSDPLSPPTPHVPASVSRHPQKVSSAIALVLAKFQDLQVDLAALTSADADEQLAQGVLDKHGSGDRPVAMPASRPALGGLGDYDTYQNSEDEGEQAAVAPSGVRQRRLTALVPKLDDATRLNAFGEFVRFIHSNTSPNTFSPLRNIPGPNGAQPRSEHLDGVG